MWRSLLGTTALIALACPAVSADLPARINEAPPVVPAWGWTGCYMGGHAGGLRASKKDWIVRTPGGDFYGQSLGRHAAGSWVGGVQGGCDYQFDGDFVIGIQGDHAWTDAVGSHNSAREFGVAYHSKDRSLSSITGRLGYSWDRFLGYVRGGGAWEHDNYSATTIIVGTAYTASVSRPGWSIGVGGEYAFTNFLSGFVEFDYYDLGTREIGFTPHLVGLRHGFIQIRDTTSVMRAGLNFHFSSWF